MQRSSNSEEFILVTEEPATAGSGGSHGSLARESSVFLGLSLMTLVEILARKTPFVFFLFSKSVLFLFLFFSPSLPSS